MKKILKILNNKILKIINFYLKKQWFYKLYIVDYKLVKKDIEILFCDFDIKNDIQNWIWKYMDTWTFYNKYYLNNILFQQWKEEELLTILSNLAYHKKIRNKTLANFAQLCKYILFQKEYNNKNIFKINDKKYDYKKFLSKKEILLFKPK